jgi:hypothetical protein
MSLLIESCSGVTEYIIGVMKIDAKPVIGVLDARVASGTGSRLDREKLEEAITLHQWALAHSELFADERGV